MYDVIREELNNASNMLFMLGLLREIKPFANTPFCLMQFIVLLLKNFVKLFIYPFKVLAVLFYTERFYFKPQIPYF